MEPVVIIEKSKESVRFNCSRDSQQRRAVVANKVMASAEIKAPGKQYRSY